MAAGFHSVRCIIISLQIIEPRVCQYMSPSPGDLLPCMFSVKEDGKGNVCLELKPAAVSALCDQIREGQRGI